MTNWIDIIIALISTVVAPLLVNLLYIGADYFKSQKQLKKHAWIIDHAKDTLETLVKEGNQLVVDKVKGTPEWNELAQKELAASVKQEFKVILGKAGIKLLEEAIGGNTDKWVNATMESLVHDNKPKHQDRIF